MAKQVIGIGSAPNDGTGDTIRDGGDKANDNFDEIYALLGTGTVLTTGLSATSSVVTLAGPTITGVASFADGSNSAPSITNTGDTNTGIYFSAADEVAVTTGGIQRVRFTNSTATFSTAISSTGSFTGGGLMTTGGDIVIPDAGTIGSASSTSAMTIASTGNVTFSGAIIGGGDITGGGAITGGGLLTTGGDIVIPDAGTIGSATTPAAITVAANGDVTFSGLVTAGTTVDFEIKNSAGTTLKTVKSFA